MRSFIALAVFALAVTSLACGGSEQNTAPPGASSANPPKSAAAPKKAEPSAEDAHAALVKEGAAVYNSTCTACHNANPNEPGSIGPAIAGSSLALLEAKVIHNTYPEGYKPKRDTKAMIPLAYLEPKIPAIHAYIESKTE